ncbi:MAG: phosphoribosylanthranilate isomerase [Leptospiraceae bacterium]|nr:phosphoribosylanthranilate isomerase [Leptospiraceae bacterium]MDW8306526.1 phosphoribosylanthranilate isomerase [Leptospiraceae bacterium]
MEEKFYVKICGITTLSDAEFCANEGADLLGFVFHPHSKRKCSLEEADKIFYRYIRVPKVLVFGYDDEDYIVEIYTRYASILTFVQIPADHPDFWFIRRRIGIHKIIPVVYVDRELDEEDLLDVEDHSLIIFDTPPQRTGVAGGSGQSFNWDYIAHIERPFLLAGGIDCSNVCEAMRRVAPLGFDVSSGLEASYGKKDRDKILKFLNILRYPSHYCP